MNFNQLKRLADKCVFSAEGVTIMKTEEYNYRLNQINQLTNNWNELEEWIIKESEKTILSVGHMTALCMVLDKMKEIKEGKNVSDRD